METAQQPFRFTGCSELHEILGKTAEDERRLVELIEEVPLDSIYFHTHSYFLRHSYVERVYPNDFAQWVASEVRDLVLGERLAVVDPFAFANLETLRDELLSIIDDHLSRMPVVPRVIYGSPFHFNQSRILKVPTGSLWRRQPAPAVDRVRRAEHDGHDADRHAVHHPEQRRLPPRRRAWRPRGSARAG